MIYRDLFVFDTNIETLVLLILIEDIAQYYSGVQMLSVVLAGKTCTFYLHAGAGMSVSSNEANRLNSQSGKSLPDADEMRHHSFAPSQLTLSIYHRLTLFAVFCMSLSASAMLIFLLLFWYCGGIFLLCALITALLGELHCRLSLSS